MSWTPMLVDDAGWDELVERGRRWLDEVLEVQGRCAQRLVEKDEAGLSCTVSILCYPSAIEERKVGPPVKPKDLSSPKSEKKKRQPSKAKGKKKKSSRQKKRKGAGK